MVSLCSKLLLVLLLPSFSAKFVHFVLLVGKNVVDLYLDLFGVINMLKKLVEIPTNRWSSLRDLYTKRKDRASCYNLLQYFINCKNKEASFPLAIYALNGEWEADGIYIAKFSNQIYCNTCGNNLERLLDALNCLDSSTEYLIAGYQESVLPAIKQYFTDANLKEQVNQATETVWYHIPKEQAAQFSIDPPDKMSLKGLEECHADQVNHVWPHRSPGSVKFVKLMIHYNDSVGVFEDGNLVAWCLILPLGSLGLLQVMETHRRRGLGNLAVRYISKLLAERDIEVTAPVVTGNVPSRTMFEKLGFKAIDKVYWVIKPATK